MEWFLNFTCNMRNLIKSRMHSLVETLHTLLSFELMAFKYRRHHIGFLLIKIDSLHGAYPFESLVLFQSIVQKVFYIGGSRGGRPPYGSRFFCFDMQNFRNVAASGVHGSPYEVHAPPTGNPGSATVLSGLVMNNLATDWPLN